MKITTQKIYSSQQGFIPLVVLAIVGIVGVGGTTAAVASQAAVPGDALYPVKELTENVRVATALSEEDKAKVYLVIAEEKLKEVEKLTQKGAPVDRIEDALERLEENQSKGLEKAQEAKSKGKSVDDVVALIEANRDRQQAVLTGVLEKVPEQAKDAIRRSLENSRQGFERAIEAVKEGRGEQGEHEDASESARPNNVPGRPETNGSNVDKPTNSPADAQKPVTAPGQPDNRVTPGRP